MSAHRLVRKDFQQHAEGAQAPLLIMIRYGGFGLGVAKEDVPPEFGRNGPTEFKKLAVRNVAKVKIVCTHSSSDDVNLCRSVSFLLVDLDFSTNSLLFQ